MKFRLAFSKWFIICFGILILLLLTAGRFFLNGSDVDDIVSSSGEIVKLVTKGEKCNSSKVVP